MRKKYTLLLLLILICTACSSPAPTPTTPAPATSPPTAAPTVPSVAMTDRAGNPMTLPAKIERILVMGPSNTEILVALGLAESIIAIDSYSDNIPGLQPDIPMFSMMQPDGEQIILLEPDIIIATAMTMVGGEDPFLALKNTGICVAYIPSSESIQDIQDDILFLGEVMGVSAKARELVTEMDREIAIIATIGNSITEKKRVYYEIAAAPYLYSFGSGTFLHEMLEIIGAINILAEVNSWAAITDEVVIDANPDVILTSVNYLDDPIGEILARPGWEAITAVANEEVYYIDNDASSRPNHHITKALIEMAKAIYPDLY